VQRAEAAARHAGKCQPESPEYPAQSDIFFGYIFHIYSDISSGYIQPFVIYPFPKIPPRSLVPVLLSDLHSPEMPPVACSRLICK